MKKPFLSLAAVGGLLLSLVPAGHAAPKDYQVTGPIVSMTDTTIVVKKGQEEWELSKEAALKPTDGSELKVGDKVTVHYTMAATTVEKKMPAKRETPPKDKGSTGTAAATPAASPMASPVASPTMAH